MAIEDVSDRSLAQLVSLEGRVAVVTGGAVGIGRAVADRLAEAGASVVIGDLDEATAMAAATELAGPGRTLIGAGLDVADAASIVALADRAVAELGRLDIWVNNAGIYPMCPILELDDVGWDRVLDVNLRGTFVGAREAARRMAAHGGGVIVNLDSTAGFRAGGAGAGAYVASKHAVRGLTKSLAVELGPLGVRVLAVAPTLVETPGIQALATSGGAAVGDMLGQLAARLPLGRTGVPDDVARVVLFCASDLSMFMTGSTLLVDAGDLAL
jgi:NAD(P)-dependent dehydrogenase (short-subunit alcohol dehydrogenase family)